MPLTSKIHPVILKSLPGGHDLIPLDIAGTLLCRKCRALVPQMLCGDPCPKGDAVAAPGRLVGQLEKEIKDAGDQWRKYPRQLAPYRLPEDNYETH